MNKTPELCGCDESMAYRGCLDEVAKWFEDLEAGDVQLGLMNGDEGAAVVLGHVRKLLALRSSADRTEVTRQIWMATKLRFEAELCRKLREKWVLIDGEESKTGEVWKTAALAYDKLAEEIEAKSGGKT